MQRIAAARRAPAVPAREPHRDTGWQPQSGLPGDRVQRVSTAQNGRPWYRDWHPSNGGVAISGPQPDEAIPAHGALVLFLAGRGSRSSPASCAFNGPSC